MSINYRISICIVITVLITQLSGCAGQQTRTKSSVVDYLYPKESNIVVQPSIPTLNIPIKVGIAFVPEQSPRSRGINLWSGVVGGGALTEANKTDLLNKVADNFRVHDFVSDIEVIPSAYLTAGGGFANLEQIKTMYGIDLIALVSYDQVQFTDEGLLSLTYWTLVGAYFVSGEKNDTSTMLDTAVYDIQSKSLLFRAPGTSNVKGRSTPINLSEELRRDSIKSFEDATTNMISNLTVQLEKFKDKIKKNPEQVKVVHAEGYTGGGAMGPFETTIMILLAGVLYCSRRMKI
ncbi:MAG: rhombotail lipoprotein [Psychromonas sp.]|jgi:rhombotail lipoprotein|uniref:rhombotarget lipoprotein n=1 Tax=Psychromonas sp. TaxID=1884585 RepID=UPI0039E3B938